MVSLAPPFEVKSILKQRPKEEVEEEAMGATASTAAMADSATLSPELFLGETKREKPAKAKVAIQ